MPKGRSPKGLRLFFAGVGRRRSTSCYLRDDKMLRIHNFVVRSFASLIVSQVTLSQAQGHTPPPDYSSTAYIVIVMVAELDGGSEAEDDGGSEV